jgi:hypothetical protein
MGAPKGNDYGVGHGNSTKYRKEYNKQAYELCLLGYTNEKLAAFFDVPLPTFENWVKKYKRLRSALESGREPADAKVAASLFERANGYSHPDEQIFNHQGSPLVVPTTKHYPPDTAAAMIWLRNRQGWTSSDKTEGEQAEKLAETLLELAKKLPT